MTTKNSFLEYIELVDFKCFKNFRVDNLKRVNLIGGKNNIGKTAFLEGCFVNARGKDITSVAVSIAGIKFMRETLNIFLNVSKGKHIGYRQFLEATPLYNSFSNKRNIKFWLNEKDGIKEYIFTINGEKNIINANDFSFNDIVTNVGFIDNFGLTDNELIRHYKTIQTKDKEQELNALIQKFDPTIESFKVIGDKPQCKFNGKYIDLTEFGDGLKHYISIICMLHACEDGQLFIDEIDNGIHYTQLQNIWKLIFDISKETNCQVFATTHSRECIEAFNAANTDDEGLYLEFYRSPKDNSIKVKPRDSEQLAYSLSHSGEFRGE